MRILLLAFANETLIVLNKCEKRVLYTLHMYKKKSAFRLQTQSTFLYFPF